jgi:hypothetical protein
MLPAHAQKTAPATSFNKFNIVSMLLKKTQRRNKSTAFLPKKRKKSKSSDCEVSNF